MYFNKDQLFSFTLLRDYMSPRARTNKPFPSFHRHLQNFYFNIGGRQYMLQFWGYLQNIDSCLFSLSYILNTKQSKNMELKILKKFAPPKKETMVSGVGICGQINTHFQDIHIFFHKQLNFFTFQPDIWRKL